MAPAISDGVPGLEALHTFTPPSPFPAFTLNDWMDPSTGLTRQWTDDVVAWTDLSTIKGLHDKPDADDPRVNLNFQQGELPFPRYGRGRTITYSGRVVAATLSDLRAHVAALRAGAASALTNPTAWYLSVAYDSTYDDSGITFVGWGVPIAFTCDDVQGAPSQQPSAFQREFDLTFRQSEGRWWVTSDLQAAGSSSSKIDSGSTGVLTMPGTAGSEPVFTVYGTGSGSATITLTGSEAGGTLEIDLLAKMASGDTLVVDFGQRTVTYTPSGGDATDYSGYIDWANSNWWSEAGLTSAGASLVPGTNTLEVDGDKWSVTAYPAVW